jgi:Reverse transcriptase (RNA-dependent DNA polymerase)
MMDELIDHQPDDTAVSFADRFIVIQGRQHLRKTTAGCWICVLWKNGETSWEHLADLKELNPLEVAKYSLAQGIDHEAAFCWWVPRVIKRHERIISAVNNRYLRLTHKFGIAVPKTIRDAAQLDLANGNTLWMDTVALEIASVGIAFKHMIFDVKLDGFCRKAHMVAGGHMAEAPPAMMTYASVVSRESLQIALTIAALHDLEVKASDVMNAYLTAPCEERVWTILGTEFGGDAGKKAIIVRALYGLKSAGASFGRHLADCMRLLSYSPCKADPDVWMMETTRLDDSVRYYAYILLYVDDVLCIHHDAEKLGQVFSYESWIDWRSRYLFGNQTLTSGIDKWSICLDNGPK